MLIWIFQTGEPLHIDKEFSRPMRAMNLANTLIEKCHKVVIWSSNFFHQKKAHRFKTNKTIFYDKNLTIKLINSIGYKSNIGLRRILDHANLGINLFKTLSQYHGELPEKVFIGYPPIEFAFVASLWCKKNNIPYLLDIKDQWPHMYLDPFPRNLRIFIKLLLFPYFSMGSWSCNNASSLVSITKEFLDWVYNFSRKQPSKNDFILPTSIIKDTKSNPTKETKTWLKKLAPQKNKKTKVIVYIGAFISDLNYIPIINAAKNALREKKDWIFVLCGDGPSLNIIKKNIGNLENTFLPGWVSQEKVNALLGETSVGLLAMPNTSNFSLTITNKTYTYLSEGVPIITSINGVIKNLIMKYNVGITYKENDKHQLYKALVDYFDDDNNFKLQSNNAKKLYKEKFDGRKVYENAVHRIEKLI